MHSVMGEYEKISCQAVNVQKPGIFFSGYVSKDLKSNISRCARSFKYGKILGTTLPYWQKQKGHICLPTGKDVEKDLRVTI